MPKRDRWDNEISEERCALAARLKNARINARMTLAEAAKAASVSSPTISRYESADIAIPLEKLSALAMAYGVSPAYLMWGSPTYNPVISVNGQDVGFPAQRGLDPAFANPVDLWLLLRSGNVQYKGMRLSGEHIQMLLMLLSQIFDSKN